MFEQYFKDIFNTTKTGDATEESYYPDLKRLIENWGEQKGKKFYITPLPKRTEAGNPDFRIWDGKQKIVGYVEAKAPTVEHLDTIQGTEQLKRYRHTFPNLILTNFFEFRLYRNGELVNSVQIGRPFVMHKLKTVPPVENRDKFLELLEQFFSFSIPKTYTARTLAIELAKRTRFLRDEIVAEELREEEKKQEGYLFGFYKAFKDHLIASLTVKDFADLYAQTITYGLFAARSRAEDGFNRKLAFDYIPRTIGILRDVFRFISSTDLPESMEWIVDDIAEVLAVADVRKIMHGFYKEGKGRDPIIHFYETFLAEYDPKEREKRGVYYTPEPVVSYIVRSIHKILKEKFGKEDGFATSSVTVLDPASGTLTFPAEAIHLAIEEYTSKYGDGGVKGLIEEHILKNFYAFELMMAPYAVGHLKIGFVLDEFGYKLSEDERFNLYLTNTLDFTKEDPDRFPGIFERAIAKESEEALEVKQNIPVMVVMGNPPYSVSSTNIIQGGSDFQKLYESYKERVRKEERNIQPLSDDYIKFLAFAHWKVTQAGQGIVGMITNNSYLDGIIHRDMRRKILEDFDEIYVLNLHGNTRRQEKTPDGGKDENVFDIQQGVSIILLVKKEGLKKQVKYADVWGLRGDMGEKNTKYDFLFSNDTESTEWKILEPKEPYCFFTEKEFKAEEEYEKFISLEDIFREYKAGIATGKDDFLVDFDKTSLLRKLSISEKSLFELKMQHYKVGKQLIDKWYQELKHTNVENQALPFSYRPFDNRFVIYNTKILQRARDIIMKHLRQDNLALLSMRQYIHSNPYSHAFVVRSVVDRRIFISNRGAAHVFPLYLYNDIEAQQQISLLQDHPTNNKTTNINVEFQALLNNSYNPQPATMPLEKQKAFDVPPEEIFYYIYAVLYSNTYREKYQEFLKIDFPRIPFTKDYGLFQKFSEFGKELVGLHLLKSPVLNNPITKFYGEGEGKVEKREYKESESRVYINGTQYFEGIEPEIWNYQIGGYQVLDKWLKDRKGHTLSAEDIKHYCKVVTALKKTIEIQKEIDKLYPEVEKNLASFNSNEF